LYRHEVERVPIGGHTGPVPKSDRLPGLADASSRRRRLREAQTASSLNHPHILTGYDIGEPEGRQYLVTEFVDSGTLRNWTAAEPRTWQQAGEHSGVEERLRAPHCRWTPASRRDGDNAEQSVALSSIFLNTYRVRP
jgi:hypothetical protein